MLKAQRVLEDAYTAIMRDRMRVFANASNPNSTSFTGSRFKKAVCNYYGVGIGSNIQPSCHVLGVPFFPNDLRAAHIVPRAMNEASLTYLFGGEVDPATDVRNSTFDQYFIE